VATTAIFIAIGIAIVAAKKTAAGEMAARETITGIALASTIAIAVAETPLPAAEMRHATLENPLREEACKRLGVTETIRQAAEEEKNVIVMMEQGLVLEAVMTTQTARKAPRPHHRLLLCHHLACPRIAGGIAVGEPTTAESATVTATAIVIGTVTETESAEMAMEMLTGEAVAAALVPGLANGEDQRAVVRMDYMTREGR